MARNGGKKKEKGGAPPYHDENARESLRKENEHPRCVHEKKEKKERGGDSAPFGGFFPGKP